MSDWFYAGSDRQQHGPVDTDALKMLIGAGRIDAFTLVWREGMSQWVPLSEVSAELGLALESASAPPVMPGNPYAAPSASARPMPGAHAPAGPIPNHLVWGILTTLLCCWPFGVVSIIYATKVESRRAEGDIDGAWEASRKAKLWALWSAGSVGIIVVLGIAFAFIAEMTK